MKKTLLTTLLFLTFNLLCNTPATAQESSYYDDKTEKELAITKDLPQEMLDKYLEQNELKAIEFNPDTNSIYTFRVQYKSGDWGLFNSFLREFYWDKGSINFPNPIFGDDAPVTLINRKKKTYFYSLLEERVLEDLWFDQIEYHKIADTITVFEWDEETQTKTELETVDDKYIDAVKRNKKWALVHLDDYDNHVHQIVKDRYIAAVKRKKNWALVYLDDYDNHVHQITPFSYKSKGDLPIAPVTHFLYEINNWEMMGYENEFHNLSSVLADGEYSEIEFHPNYKEADFVEVRLKNKKGNWGFFNGSGTPVFHEGYSLQFPVNKYGDYTIAERKNKKYIYFLGEGGLQDHIWFDAYKEHFYENYAEYEVPDENGDFKFQKDTIRIYDYIQLKRGDKWAMAFFYPETQRLYQLTGFHFHTAEEIPDSLLSNFYYDNGYERTYINEYQADAVSDFLQENEKMDIVTFFGHYKYSENELRNILLAHHATTKRWSIQILGSIRPETEFPVAANAIKPHEYGGEEAVVLETWCDDKVGYYFYNGEDIQKILPCEHDDFKYVHLDYTRGCALKKNGYWELYSAEAPEKLVEGKSKTIDGLLELWWNR